jgi:tagatose 1,6-diphosphate aldolase
VDFKLLLCRTLAPATSGLLLDPVYGVHQTIAAGALPGNAGLLVSMEATGYTGDARARITTLLDGWSAAKARRAGASAAKLLVYYRPDLEETARRQRETVRRLADACAEQDLPLLVEAVAYPIGDEEKDRTLYRKRRPGLVTATAHDLGQVPGVDILKLEFPLAPEDMGDPEKALAACQEVDAVAGLPWVLLSRGVSYEVFLKQVDLACRSGASGFLGGRAIWQEATQMRDEGQRRRFLETTGVQRLRELGRVVEEHGTPWAARLPLPAERLPDDWYASY